MSLIPVITKLPEVPSQFGKAVLNTWQVYTPSPVVVNNTPDAPGINTPSLNHSMVKPAPGKFEFAICPGPAFTIFTIIIYNKWNNQTSKSRYILSC